MDTAETYYAEVDAAEVGNRFLLRNEASEKLREWFGPAGYTSPTTLAKLACIGGGPPMIKFGRKVSYPERALFGWAKSRMRYVAHTSDDH